jgi:hypothetical protein
MSLTAFGLDTARGMSLVLEETDALLHAFVGHLLGFMSQRATRP